jgi:hypothetical protein
MQCVRVADQAWDARGRDIAGVATRVVLPGSDRFEMFWIHTERHPAKMINDKAGGNRAVRQFIGDAMGELMLELSITAISERRSRPEPAPIRSFVDL